jgi:hypothetical protein
MYNVVELLVRRLLTAADSCFDTDHRTLPSCLHTDTAFRSTVVCSVSDEDFISLVNISLAHFRRRHAMSLHVSFTINVNYCPLNRHELSLLCFICSIPWRETKLSVSAVYPHSTEPKTRLTGYAVEVACVTSGQNVQVTGVDIFL